jgi:hypothetical protein
MTLVFLYPVVSVWLLLGAIAHTVVGWLTLRPGLAQAQVEPGLAIVINAGWYFGSVAMLLLAIVVFLSWREIRNGRGIAKSGTVAIAAGYVAFGMLMFVQSGRSPHFIIEFVAPGVLLALAAGSREPSAARRS